LHSPAQDPSSIHAHKLTEKLASFCVATRAEDLPAAALESGRQLILDTIGVSLLASAHKIGRLISAQAAELGGHAQAASVFGAGNLKVAPVFAAQANGTMANALDYDGGGHLPTHILPRSWRSPTTWLPAGTHYGLIACEAAVRPTKVTDAKRVNIRVRPIAAGGMSG
jgi:hypothetical protein